MIIILAHHSKTTANSIRICGANRWINARSLSFFKKLNKDYIFNKNAITRVSMMYALFGCPLSK